MSKKERRKGGPRDYADSDDMAKRTSSGKMVRIATLKFPSVYFDSANWYGSY